MDEKTFEQLHRRLHERGKVVAGSPGTFALLHKREHRRLAAQALTASLAVQTLQARMHAPRVEQLRAKMRAPEEAARLRARMRALRPSKRAGRRPTR